MIHIETQHLRLEPLSDERLKEDKRSAEWTAGWEIFLKETNRPAGRIGFAATDKAGRMFLDFWIDPEHQGRGHRTEAVSKASHWALEEPGITAVLAAPPAGDDGARRALLKNDFSEEGQFEGRALFILRHDVWRDGTF